VLIVLVVVLKEIALLGLTLGYIFYGLIRHLRRKPAQNVPEAGDEDSL